MNTFKSFLVTLLACIFTANGQCQEFITALTQLQGTDKVRNASGTAVSNVIQNGTINVSVASTVTYLDLFNRNMTCLDGLEYFTNLYTLDLSENQLTALPQALSTFTNLTELYVAHNQITEIPSLTAASGMSYLNCSYNQLSALPAFHIAIPSLEIDCSHNQITGTLNIPLNCRRLDCSYNQITNSNEFNGQYVNCSHNQFTNMNWLGYYIGLNYLDCSYNQITSIPAREFASGLYYYDCSHNQLTSLPSMHYYRFGLYHFDCSYNQLTSLPDLSTDNKLQMLICNNNQLTALPLFNNHSSLYMVNCAHNAITSLPSFATNTYLHELDASYNSNLSSITFPAPSDTLTVNLRETAINCLSAQPNAKVGLLGMTRNGEGRYPECGYVCPEFLTALAQAQANGTIWDASFQPITNLISNGVIDNTAAQNVGVLSLANMGLTCLDGIHLMPNIWFLEINKNPLVSLPSLQYNTAIRQLDCRECSLEGLPSMEFNTALEGLYLQDNPKLTALPNLDHNTSLKLLNVSGSGLTALPSLAHNTALETLALQSNKLTSLPDLSHNLALEGLGCSGNLLTQIPDLSGLPNLGYLGFENNQVTTFPNLPISIVQLDFSHNQISGLMDVSHLTNLTYLNADHNQIKQVKLHTTDPVMQINLDANPGLCFVEEPRADFNIYGVDRDPATGKVKLCGSQLVCPEFLAALEQAQANGWITTPSYQLINNLINNGVINTEVAQTVGTFDVSNMNLSCLDGIHLFPNLIRFNASSNPLRSLPSLDGNPALEFISINESGLEVLPSFDQLPELKILIAQQNPNLSQLPNLDYNTKLNTISMQGSGLVSLPSLEHNTLLQYLSVPENNLTSIPDLSHNLGLKVIDLFDNQLEQIPDLGNHSLLTSLSIQKNNLTHLPTLPSSLNWLSCYDNNIAGLVDISHLTSLDVFIALNNEITKIKLPRTGPAMEVNLMGNPDVCFVEAPRPEHNVSGVAIDPETGTYKVCDVQLVCSEFIAALADVQTTGGVIGKDGQPITNLVQNGAIDPSIAEEVDHLYISSKNLTCLDGIHMFTNLTRLDANYNPLGTLPSLDQNTQLEVLNCNHCQLESLPSFDLNTKLKVLFFDHNPALKALPNLDNCPNISALIVNESGLESLPNLDHLLVLDALIVSNNHLTSLPNLSLNTRLRLMNISDNDIEVIQDLSHTSLVTFAVGGNRLTALPNLPSSITQIACNDNLFTNLDISTLTTLVSFYAASNNICTLILPEPVGSLSVNINNNPGICLPTIPSANIEITGSYTLCSQDVCPDFIAAVGLQYPNCVSSCGTLIPEVCASMTSLDLYNKGLTCLNGIELFTGLQSLNISRNNLTAINLSKNTQLVTLECANNQLTALSVSALTQLQNLDVVANQLQELILSNNTQLIELKCSGNRLSGLNLANNTSLTRLVSVFNQLNSIDLSANRSLTEVDIKNNTICDLLLPQPFAALSVDLSFNPVGCFQTQPSNNISIIGMGKDINGLYPICGSDLADMDLVVTRSNDYNPLDPKYVADPNHCEIRGTLRWCVLKANERSGKDTITFRLSGDTSVSVNQNITITDSLFLDGSTQRAFYGNKVNINQVSNTPNFVLIANTDYLSINYVDIRAWEGISMGLASAKLFLNDMVINSVIYGVSAPSEYMTANIDSCKFIGSGYYGLYFSGGHSQVDFTNSLISDKSEEALYVGRSDKTFISQSTINNVKRGITIENGNSFDNTNPSLAQQISHTVEYSVFTNISGKPIDYSQAFNVTVKGNKFENCGDGIKIYFGETASNLKFTDNILKTVDKVVGGSALEIYMLTNAYVYNNTFEDVNDGIFLAVKTAIIRKNTFLNNTKNGISVYYSWGGANTLDSNQFIGCEFGIYGSDSDYYTVSNNLFKNCTKSGIGHHLSFAYADNWKLINNTFDHNGQYGVEMVGYVKNTYFEGNYFFGNNLGGIYNSSQSSGSDTLIGNVFGLDREGNAVPVSSSHCISYYNAPPDRIVYLGLADKAPNIFTNSGHFTIAVPQTNKFIAVNNLFYDNAYPEPISLNDNSYNGKRRPDVTSVVKVGAEYKITVNAPISDRFVGIYGTDGDSTNLVQYLGNAAYNTTTSLWEYTTTNFLGTPAFVAIANDASGNTSEVSNQVEVCGLIVTHTRDDGSYGSLRACIECANAIAGKDTITFEIPGDEPKVIGILSGMPSITDSVLISGNLDGEGNPLVRVENQIPVTEDINSDTVRCFKVASSNTTIENLEVGDFYMAVGLVNDRPSLSNIKVQNNYFNLNRLALNSVASYPMSNIQVIGNHFHSSASSINQGYGTGVHISGTSALVIKSNNFTGSSSAYMLSVGGSSNGVYIEDNLMGINKNLQKATDFDYTVANSFGFNAITIGQNVYNLYIRNNTIGNVGTGISMDYAGNSSTIIVIENNHIGCDTQNGKHDVLYGIRTLSHPRYVYKTIENNTIKNFHTAGIATTTYGFDSLASIRISKNILENTDTNVPAIRKSQYSPFSPDHYTVHPRIITSHNSYNDLMVVRGKADAGDSIEVFYSKSDGIESADAFVGGAKADANGDWTLSFTKDPNYTWIRATKTSYFNTSLLSVPYKLGKVPCVVTTTADVGPGSIREAFTCANLNEGKDTVTFNIPPSMANAEGKYVIAPETELPYIIDSVLIDGFSQAGLDNQAIVITGDNFESHMYLQYLIRVLKEENGQYLNVSDVTIQGLTLSSTMLNMGYTISLERCTTANVNRNIIVGPIHLGLANGVVLERNEIKNAAFGCNLSNSENVTFYKNDISHHQGYGINTDELSKNIVIEENTIHHNSNGITSNAFNINVLKNHIYANTEYGVLFSGLYSDKLYSATGIIKGNYIGTDKDLAPNLGNTFGIAYNSAGSEYLTIEGNTIVSNKDHGIVSTYVTNTITPLIIKNYIGVTATGVSMPNLKDGIHFEEYNNAQIGGDGDSANIVAYNGGNGVNIGSRANNIELSRNIIFGNILKSVSLHKNSSSYYDGNNGKKTPYITGKQYANGQYTLTVKAEVTDTRIEIFKGEMANTQNTFEFISDQAVSQGNGTWTITFPRASAEEYFVATATGNARNTSEIGSEIGSCFVTDTADAGPGTLREAILCANQSPVATRSRIKFAIPESKATAGRFVIALKTALPPLNADMWIDGFSQAGRDNYKIVIDARANQGIRVWDGNTLPKPTDILVEGIELKNMSGDGFVCYYTSGVVLRKNKIHNGYNGINCNDAQNIKIISNEIYSCNGSGIYVNKLQNSFIDSNTVSGNNRGIEINYESKNVQLSHNTVHGQTQHGFNVSGSNIQDIRIFDNEIYGNIMSGIMVGADFTNLVIKDNFIGTTRAQATSISNGTYGISFEQYYSGNLKEALVDHNVIVGNGSGGIYKGYLASSKIRISRNYIGINTSNAPMSNMGDGIYLTGMGDVRIGGILDSANVIAYNALNGIYLNSGAEKVDIARNTIKYNSLRAIALYQAGTQFGANNSKKTPFITSKVYENGQYTLKVQTEATDTRIEIFTSNDNRQNAFAFITDQATNLGFGEWRVTFPSAEAGQTFTATATGNKNNTSELGYEIVKCLTVTTTADKVEGSLRAALECANTYNDLSTITFALDGNGPHVFKREGTLSTDDFPRITAPTIINGYALSDSIIIDGEDKFDVGFYVLRTDYYSTTQNNYTEFKNIAVRNFKSDGIRVFNDKTVVDHCLIYRNKQNGVAAVDGAKVVKILSSELAGSQSGYSSRAEDSLIVENSIIRNNGTGLIAGALSATVYKEARIKNNQILNNQYGINTTRAGGNNYNLYNNLISGNTIYGAVGNFNIVKGNTFGMAPNMINPMPNGVGLSVGNYSGINIVDSNTIVASIGNGFESAGFVTHPRVITRNYVGVLRDGRVFGNGSVGIYVSSIPKIGGATLDSANVVGGNLVAGIQAYSTVDGIINNYIGIMPDGRDVGNIGSGIWITSSGKVYNNYIGQNHKHGVEINSGEVKNNFIGTDLLGNNLGNDSAGVKHTSSSVITENNIIKYNFRGIDSRSGYGGAIVKNQIANNNIGVEVLSGTRVIENSFKANNTDALKVYSTGNKISRNTFANTAATYNAIRHIVDAPKSYNGNLQKSKPVINSYNFVGSSLVLTGTAQVGDTIEVFMNDGTSLQNANSYVGKVVSATTTWTYTFVPNSIVAKKNNWFVATSSNTANNTSELSGRFAIGACSLVVTKTIDDNSTGTLRNCMICANVSAGKDTISFQFATGQNVLVRPTSDLPILTEDIELVNNISNTINIDGQNSRLYALRVSNTANYLKVKNLSLINYTRVGLLSSAKINVLENVKLRSATPAGDSCAKFTAANELTITNSALSLGKVGLYLDACKKVTVYGTRMDTNTVSAVVTTAATTENLEFTNGQFLGNTEVFLGGSTKSFTLVNNQIGNNAKGINFVSTKTDKIIINKNIVGNIGINPTNRQEYGIKIKIGSGDISARENRFYNLDSGLVAYKGVYSGNDKFSKNNFGRNNTNVSWPNRISVSLRNVSFDAPSLDSANVIFKFIDIGLQASASHLKHAIIGTDEAYTRITVSNPTPAQNIGVVLFNNSVAEKIIVGNCVQTGVELRASTLDSSYIGGYKNNIFANFYGVTSPTGYGANTIRNCVIKNSINAANDYGVGLYGSGTTKDLITKSLFVNNGIATGRVGILYNGPNNYPVPVLTGYRFKGANVVLFGTANTGDKVEVFLNDNIKDNALKHINTATAVAGKWEMEILAGEFFNETVKNYYVATATSTSNVTSAFSTIYTVGCKTCICTVTQLADNTNVGTLRNTITRANTGECLNINFQPGLQGTISIYYALPDLLVPVSINAPAWVNRNPTITLNCNNSMIGFAVKAEGVTLKNIGVSTVNRGISIEKSYTTLRNVAVSMSGSPIVITSDSNRLLNTRVNMLGVNNADTIRAIKIYGSKNLLISDTLLNAGSGVLTKGQNNTILNSYFETNKLAISHEAIGNGTYEKPYELAGALDNGVAKISGKAKQGDKVQAFLSDLNFIQDATKFAGETIAGVDGKWEIIVSGTLIDLTKNNYFIATATSATGNTSQLSEVVRVGNFPQTCYVDNTANTGKGSLRSAIDCVNKAGKGSTGVNASVVFRLPTGVENVITLASPLNVKNDKGVLIDPGTINVKINNLTNTDYAFSWSNTPMTLSNLNFDRFNNTLKDSGSVSVISGNFFDNYITAVTSISTSNTTLHNNTFGTGNTVINATAGKFVATNNKIGITKTGTQVGQRGIAFNIANSADGQIVNNRFYSSSTQLLNAVGANGLQFVNNTVEGLNSYVNAVELSNSKKAEIRNNTFSGYHNVFKLTNMKSSNLILNTINGATVFAFDLLRSDSIEISRNIVRGTEDWSEPINLHYGTIDQSNAGKKAPAITTITFYNGKVHLKGTSAYPLDTIEVFSAMLKKQALEKHEGSVRTDYFGNWEMSLTIPITDVYKYFFRAVVVGDQSQTASQASVSKSSDLKPCFVLFNTDAASATVNTLRHCINQANANTINYIGFQLPVGATQITPVLDMPVFTGNNLIIDGTSQTGYLPGKPIVKINGINASVTYGFKATPQNSFNIHGMHIFDTDTAIIVRNGSQHEISFNKIENFGKVGIKATTTTNTKISGVIKQNKLISPTADIGILTRAEGEQILTDTIEHVKSKGIWIQGKGQNVMANVLQFNLSATDLNYGIHLQNANKCSLKDNKISNADIGLMDENGSANLISATTIETVSKTVFKNIGVYIKGTNTDTLGLTKVKRYQTGVLLENANNNYLIYNTSDTTQNEAVKLSNAQNNILQYFSATSTKKALALYTSSNNRIANNTLYGYSEVGIELNTGSTNDSIYGNTLGDKYDQKQPYAAGVAIKIYSNSNTVGKSKVPNYIFHNEKGGVYVQGGLYNKIAYNVIYENDITKARPTQKGIGLFSNGNNNKAVPVILSHKWIGDKLHLKGTAIAGDSVHVYSGLGGYQEARKWMATALTLPDNSWEAIIDTLVVKVPETTIYLTATATNSLKNTSELARNYIIGDCYVTSLLDNTDDEYPLPNTLRAAVYCANVQKEKVAIRYKVYDQYPKIIKLEKELLSLNNPLGTNYYGTNIVNKSEFAILDKATTSTATTAWTIQNNQGPTEIDHLGIANHANGLILQSDSIAVKNSSFANYSTYGVSISSGLSYVGLDTCSFASTNATSWGVNVGSTADTLAIANSRFDNAANGIKATGVAAFLIQKNTFGALTSTNQKAIALDNSTGISLSNNFFYGQYNGTNVVSWNNTVGVINNNYAFVTKGIPLSISNTAGTIIKGNTIDTSAANAIELTNSSGLVLEENKISYTGAHALHFNGTTDTKVYRNQLDSVRQDAIHLENSSRVWITKNTILNTDKTKALNIDLNLTAATESNVGHPAPINLAYAMKKVDKRRSLVISGEATPGDSVELFFSDTINPTLNKYIASGLVNSQGLWEIPVTKELLNKDPKKWHHFVAVALKQDHNTSQVNEFVLDVPPITEIFYVRNTRDDGANSLRDALRQVDSTDVRAKIVFNILPEFRNTTDLEIYRIKLDSIIDPVFTNRGFTMDGNTQKTFDIDDNLESRVIIDGATFDSTYVLNLTSASDSCKISTLEFDNCSYGIQLNNSGNIIEHISFYNSTRTLADTAFAITEGSSNVINDLNIETYKIGVLIEGTSKENEIKTLNAHNGTKIGLKMNLGAEKNEISESEFSTDSIACQINGTDKTNNFVSNTIKDAKGYGVVLENTHSQKIANNYIFGITQDVQGRAGGIVLKNDVRFNLVTDNKIGFDQEDNTDEVVKGFGIMLGGEDPTVDTIVSNFITNNQIIMPEGDGIVMHKTTANNIAGNYIGFDGTENENMRLGVGNAVKITNAIQDALTDNFIVDYVTDGITVDNSQYILMNRNVSSSLDAAGKLIKGIDLNGTSNKIVNSTIPRPTIASNQSDYELIDTTFIKIKGTALPFASVEIYQGTVHNSPQAVQYVNKTRANASGNWTFNIPSTNFSIDKDNYYVVQQTLDREGSEATLAVNPMSSEYSDRLLVDDIFCKLIANGSKLFKDKYEPCPGPDFVLNAPLPNLKYAWDINFEQADKPDIQNLEQDQIQLDTSAQVTLTMTLVENEIAKCSLVNHINVDFRPKIVNPEILVATEVFAKDTIVVVDVAPVALLPTQYQWITTPSVSVVKTWVTGTDSLSSVDNKYYPKGRYVELIFPDSGTYHVTQRITDGVCFAAMTKEIKVDKARTVRNSTQKNAEKAFFLTVYPNPVIATSSYIEARVASSAVSLLTIIDATGKIVHEQVLSGAETYKIHMPEMSSAGFYTVKLRNENEVLRTNFIYNK